MECLKSKLDKLTTAPTLEDKINGLNDIGPEYHEFVESCIISIRTAEIDTQTLVNEIYCILNKHGAVRWDNGKLYLKTDDHKILCIYIDVCEIIIEYQITPRRKILSRVNKTTLEAELKDLLKL